MRNQGSHGARAAPQPQSYKELLEDGPFPAGLESLPILLGSKNFLKGPSK